MIAQICEILTTYWHRAISSRLAMLVAIVPVIGMLEAVLVEKKQIAMAIWLGVYWPAIVALHFKEQLIQINQRRLPNALAAHVIVVVGLLVLCGLGLPAARMAIGIWSWGALGFVFALSAVTFALFAVQTGWLLLVITPFIFIACFDSVQKWLEGLCEGRHEAFAWPLLAAGICGMWATLASLVQISEEDARYFGRLDPRSYPRREPSTDDAQSRAAYRNSLAWRLMAPSERQIQLWPQWARGSPWQRVRLWNSRHIAWLTQVPEAFAYLIVIAVSLFTPAEQRSVLVKGNAFLLIFFPAWTAAGTMWVQRNAAAIELLRPVRRSQFLIDTGLAYAYRIALDWGLNSIAWCVLAYVLVWANPSEMLSVVVLTAAIQVFLFGLSAWVMRYIHFTTFGALLTFGIVGVFATGFLSMLWAVGTASFSVPLLLAPIIAVAGALITWDAYRRWLQTELA
jgi:hypothetical protein